MTTPNAVSTGDWWRSLNEECPITLESLASLPYPPFALEFKTSSRAEKLKVSYFDGLALASYIVSRGIFQNPLTREDLTMADCRRLDDYLEEFCYKDSMNEPTGSTSALIGSRRISVAEAFGLRQVIQVKVGGESQSRAQALQSTATAALAGLFVYGNDRGTRSNTVATEAVAGVPSLPREDQLMMDWGFDLNRRIEDSSTWIEDGWMVIDDDEAQVVASQSEAYDAAQRAFPSLPQEVEQSQSNHEQPQRHRHTDEEFLGTVRAMSLADKQEEVERQRRLETVRQQHLLDALQRRAERKANQRRERQIRRAQYQEAKGDDEELTRARAEIEQWREDRWERLRLISEAHALAKKEEERKRKTKAAERTTSLGDAKSTTALDPVEPTPEEELERKKAKVAAKRKRAKERKRAQKVKEQEALAKIEEEKALDAKRKESANKCDACGVGILGCGFEKYNHKFCSTKCARTAKPS